MSKEKAIEKIQYAVYACSVIFDEKEDRKNLKKLICMMYLKNWRIEYDKRKS